MSTSNLVGHSTVPLGPGGCTICQNTISLLFVERNEKCCCSGISIGRGEMVVAAWMVCRETRKEKQANRSDGFMLSFA